MTEIDDNVIAERWIIPKKDKLFMLGRNGVDMYVSGRDPQWPRAYKSDETDEAYFPDHPSRRVCLVDADWLDRLLISCERQFLEHLEREKREDFAD